MLFTQQLEKADDSLYDRVDTVAGFKMNSDNSNPTLKRIWFEQGRTNSSLAEREEEDFSLLSSKTAARKRANAIPISSAKSNYFVRILMNVHHSSL